MSSYVCQKAGKTIKRSGLWESRQVLGLLKSQANRTRIAWGGTHKALGGLT